MTQTANDLDARYGRQGRAGRGRWIAIAAAAAGAVVVVAWVWWAGALAPQAQIGVETLGYEVIDDTETRVDYQVTVEDPTPVDCAVQALDADFATVGWRVVHFAASEEHARQFSTTLRTSHLAVSGLIYRCWQA